MANITALTGTLEDIKYKAFVWRDSLSLAQKLALALAMAGLTGIVAQLSFRLPFTPIPITGQTFAVLLAGVFLGKWWGGISQAIYAVLGFSGVNWFAGHSGGMDVFFGSSVGYIIGFVFAAFFIGYISDKYVQTRNFLPMLGLMLVANFVLIHGMGLFFLNSWLSIVLHKNLSFSALLGLGTYPFIIGDLLKAVAAAAVAKAITPKETSAVLNGSNE